jgi:hypothetical protein
MNELINLKAIWSKAVEKWRTSFATVLIAVAAFFFGMLVENKIIVDDCKFAGVFRDGAQAYSCQPSVRSVR